MTLPIANLKQPVLQTLALLLLAALQVGQHLRNLRNFLGISSGQAGVNLQLKLLLLFDIYLRNGFLLRPLRLAQAPRHDLLL
jgi:hypothetical protein